jgi:PKD repeat protein
MKKLFTTFLLSILFLGAKSQCTDLFISEYIEGSSNNKVIEIYNPTLAPVNLADYSLKLYSNGSITAAATVTLTGTLNPLSTFVICHGSSNATILGMANQTSSGVINFNGDDVVELLHLTVPIDRFGIIGTDPGTSWTISGNANGAVNKTLVRKQNVQMGDLTWTGTGEDQWIIYNQDVINYLDLHVMNTCGSSLTGTGSGGAICQDIVSSFTASGSAGAGTYSYIWDYGDGTTQGNTATVNHTFAAAGTYNITFVIYDISLNVYSETFALTVNPAPTACATVSGNDGCAPDNICFTDCSTGGVVLYDWNFDDGNTASSASPCNNYAIDGSYNVTLVATNSFDCDDTTTIAITIDPSGDASFDYSQSTFCSLDSDPTPNITGNTGGTFSCNGCIIDANTGVIDISASSAGNYTVTYTEGTSPCEDVQTFGISISGSAPDPTINSVSPLCTGDANITLTAANTGGVWSATCGACIDASTGEFSPSAAGNGTHTITYEFTGSCATNDTEQIVVNTSADATITPISAICNDGSTLTLNVVDAGGTWSATCGSCINTTTGLFNTAIAGSGTHTITYTITGTCGDIGNTNITVNPQDFLNIYNSDTTICNDIFGFFLNAEAGGIWSGTFVSDNSNGDGFFSSAAITPGTYYAVYSTSSACPFEDSIQIDVFDYPVANFTFSGTLGNISFTNTSTNATSYSWDFDDATALSTQTNPTHVFALNGNYNVCLTATNATGCENTTCQNVNVTGLGINESSLVKWNVYPNPSNGNFTVESNSIITKISVKNVIGQNVFTKNVNANNTIISLEDVNNGFYFIELETENGKAVKRIEVTK